MSVPRLLLVDDDAHWRDLAALKFGQAGFEVVPAESAEEASRLLDDSEFDLVLSDLQMPQTCGWEFRRRVRRTSTRRKTPFAFISGTERKAGDPDLRPRFSKSEEFAVLAERLHTLAQRAPRGAIVPERDRHRATSVVSWMDRVREKFQLVGKRLLDLVVSFCVGLALLPFMAAIAIAIKLTDGGPVLFVQDRVGKDGQPFKFRKFRSMRVGAAAELDDIKDQNSHEESITFKMKQDPRVTSVGRFLRRTSLDELPQLWNVLVGDMSLVGPRPPIPEEVEQYGIGDWVRLNARPGLTGLWQVSGRGDLPFREQLELDSVYIQDWSLWRDLEILFKTVPAVLSGRGAY